jgi:hypothetical protein
MEQQRQKKKKNGARKVWQSHNFNKKEKMGLRPPTADEKEQNKIKNQS